MSIPLAPIENEGWSGAVAGLKVWTVVAVANGSIFGGFPEFVTAAELGVLLSVSFVDAQTDMLLYGPACGGRLTSVDEPELSCGCDWCCCSSQEVCAKNARQGLCCQWIDRVFSSCLCWCFHEELHLVALRACSLQERDFVDSDGTVHQAGTGNVNNVVHPAVDVEMER